MYFKNNIMTGIFYFLKECFRIPLYLAIGMKLPYLPEAISGVVDLPSGPFQPPPLLHSSTKKS